jgi:hypothetical protein
MLRISGTEPAARPTLVKTDDYIPLDVDWGYDVTVPMLYWRTGNMVRSLVELGIQRESAAIVSITVTLADDQVRMAEEPRPHVPEEHGHPVCDVDRWRGDDGSGWKEWVFVDEPGPFDLSIHGDRVRIWFDEVNPVARAIVSGRARFYLSASGDLLGISIDGVGKDDREAIVDSVAWQIATAGTPMIL